MEDGSGVPGRFAEDVEGANWATGMSLVKMAHAATSREDADEGVEEIMSPGALELREACQASLDRAAYTGSKIAPPRLTAASTHPVATSPAGGTSPPLVHNGLLGVPKGTVDPLGNPAGFLSPPLYDPVTSPPSPPPAASPPLSNPMKVFCPPPPSPRSTRSRTRTSQAASNQGPPVTQPIASSSCVLAMEPPSASQPVPSRPRPRQIYKPSTTSDVTYIEKNGKTVKVGPLTKRKRLDIDEQEDE
jgi:hypothetical protein